MPLLKVKRSNGQEMAAQITELADYCPYCHKYQRPSSQVNFHIDDSTIYMVYRCTNTNCAQVFMSSFRRNAAGHFEFSCNLNGISKSQDFGEDIEGISKKFTEIFNEAIEAESYNLDEISGVGFRKALEFLIKDYCMFLKPDDKEKIIKMGLANVISTYVKDTKIKSISKRAVWLGNDETHYYRKWEGKSVEDVKKLIELTVYWIKMELLTNNIVADMPEELKKK